MGMSAYGKEDYLDEFHDLIRLLPNGKFELNLEYFNFHTHGTSKWVSKKFEEVFGDRRLVNSKYEQRHFDIALGLQRIVEETGIHLARFLYKKTKSSNLCLAGGVALNVLMNKKIAHPKSGIINKRLIDFFSNPGILNRKALYPAILVNINFKNKST